MNTTPEKTPTREEQIRQLVASARKDIDADVAERRLMMEESAKKMEAAEARSRELADALETYLNEPDEVKQEPINLESKMKEAVVEEDEPDLLTLPLNDTDEKEQFIVETSERSALRPSRRDTNSPEVNEPSAHGIAQDVRGHTRPGQVQEYFNFQENYDQRADQEEQLDKQELVRRLRFYEQKEREQNYQSDQERAIRSAQEARITSDRVGAVRKSFGGPKQAIAMYDVKDKVEALNGLELLTSLLKSNGLKNCQLVAVKPPEVYKFIEACDRVSKLHTVFFHFFQALIAPDVWIAIQAWNGARKKDSKVPDKWWPIREDMPTNTFVGRGGFIDTTKLGSHSERGRIPKYNRAVDLNDVHGEGLRGIGWKPIMNILRAMVAPKKERDFQLQLETEANRRLSKGLKEQLLKHKGPLRLVDAADLSTEAKQATAVIKETIEYLQGGRKLAKDAHEPGYSEFRYTSKDGLESMIKTMFESWGMKHSLFLHAQLHTKWPHKMIGDLREQMVQSEPGEGQHKKVTTLEEYWAITEEYWTSLYDIGNSTVTILDDLGVQVDKKHLGSMSTSERLYTETEMLKLKADWKSKAQEKTKIALQAGELVLQASNGIYQNRFKGTPMCFKTAGRMCDEDRECDGLTKGGGPCPGHDNRDPKDWIAGTQYMIESTKRDLVYHEKRLKHLEALNLRIKKEGQSAVPEIKPLPGRHRPLNALELDYELAEAQDASYIAGVVNALDSSSDTDDVSM